MPELPAGLSKFLEPMSADAPCGENLEYDLKFMELMRTAEGTPEQVMGDSVIPGEEPNWREVRSGALELFEKTRDLRLSMVLSLALLKLEGLPGLRDGLGLMRGLLEKFWDSGLYPQLDPDDNNDPTFRLNVLSSFAAPPGTFERLGRAGVLVRAFPHWPDRLRIGLPGDAAGFARLAAALA